MTDTNLLWLNVTISSGALLVIFSILSKISHKLARIEQRLESLHSPQVEVPAMPEIESNPGSAFETFLNEESGRRALSKSEQFAAYRNWRKEKGMNWAK